VAYYTRTLSLANADLIDILPAEVVQAQADATEEAPTTATDAVTGRVINGTANGTVPPDLQVVLFIFTPDENPQQIPMTISADGSFQFDNITIRPDAQYVTTVIYRDRVFASGLTTPPPNATGLDLPITIYELTEDPAVIEVAGLVTQVNAVGETLEVAQVFSFRNTSDRTFSTNQASENGRPISLVISLPPGALVAGLTDNQQRYVVLQDSFLLIDTAPVMPGEEHIVQVVYVIQYNESAIIEQPINYAVNGPVRLLMRPETLGVRSEQLPQLGAETIGTTQYMAYGATLNLAAGDVIRYEVSGSTLTTAQRDTGAVATGNLPPIVIGVIVGEAVLIFALVLWYRGRRAKRLARAGEVRSASATPSSIPQPSADQSLIDGLIRQIAELDAAHERGEIDSASYQRQRGALKSRLADLMDR
jgi:hypothetical protein